MDPIFESPYALICALAALSVIILFINEICIKTQMSIAVTFAAMIGSLIIIILGKYIYPDLLSEASATFDELNFRSLLLNGVLGFLLFAGALNIDLERLKSVKWDVGITALFSTFISTLVIGGLSYWVLNALGVEIKLIYCLLFGALISPTDPIAVLAIIKSLKAPAPIAIKVEGESLFNDGIGLVLFVTLFSVAFNGGDVSVGNVAKLFITDAGGGILFGLVLGLIVHWLAKNTTNQILQLLITFQVPLGGFVLANYLDISGALAMVTAGIFVGNKTLNHAMDAEAKSHISIFWHSTEELINALLFLILGFALLDVNAESSLIVFAFIAIPLVLFARWISIIIPFTFLRQRKSYEKYTVRIMVWGGLRGALAIAMAMAIPKGIALTYGDTQLELKDVILLATYAVVVFSILVQAPTIKGIIRKSKIAVAEHEKANNP